MNKLVVVAALFHMVCSAGAQTTSPTTAGVPLSPKSSSATLSELQLRGSAPTMFATLVREVGLSGGVATSNEGCSRGAEGTVSVPAGTSFEKAVTQIAKLRTASKWQLDDGVANFFPAGGVPPLLEVQIRSFSWDRATPVREVLDRLRQLPEVIQEASKIGLREAPIEGGSSTICIRGDCSEKTKPATMPETEESVSLLTVLNRLVRAHNGAVWDYSEYRCDNGSLFSLSVLSE
jgi:hypothetical protein